MAAHGSTAPLFKAKFCMASASRASCPTPGTLSPALRCTLPQVDERYSALAMRRMVEKLTAAGWLLAFQGLAALLCARADDVAQQLRACCARWEAEQGRQAHVAAQQADVCAQASAGAPQAALQQGHNRASAAAAGGSAASAPAGDDAAAGSTAAPAPATTAAGDSAAQSAVEAGGGSAAAAAVLHTAGHVRVMEEGAALVVPEPDVLAALHGEGECPADGARLWQLVLEQWEVYRCVPAGCAGTGRQRCTGACVRVCIVRDAVCVAALRVP